MDARSGLVDQGRMLTITQVLDMWPVSRQVLWRLSNNKNEDKRLPSYKVGGKRLYKYDELMWYLDKHKTRPNETKSPEGVTND
jgi:hypothetical protein